MATGIGRPRARVRAILSLTTLALLLGGCAGSSAFSRPYEAGDFTEAHRVFDSDSSFHTDADVVFSAALMYSDPASPVHDTARARRELERLLDMDSAQSNRYTIGVLRRLLVRLTEVASRLRDAERDNDELRQQVDRVLSLMKEARESYDERSVAQAARIDSLQGVADSLTDRLRRVKEEFVEVKKMFEEMREIDLDGEPAQPIEPSEPDDPPR